MKTEQIVKKLKEIMNISELSDEQLKNEYTFLNNDNLTAAQRYPVIAGIMQGEVLKLIRQLEKQDESN